MQEIFRSPRIMADATVRGDDTLVIGFSFHPYPRPGAGPIAQLDQKTAFAFSLADVVCQMSFPYPIEETQRCLEALAAFARPFRRVVTFGESLGGFAALNFAAHVGAETAIASSPPFTLSPEKMPSETRWGIYTRSVNAFPWDHIEKGLAVLRRLYLLYDAATPDVAHVDAIAALAPQAMHLTVPFGGHPVSRVMNQGGTMAELIAAMVEGRLAPVQFRQAVRASRRRSQTYLRNLAAAQPGRRDGLRVRLLEMSQALEPTAHTLLAMLPPLVRLGRKEDVQALSRSLVETDAANARRLNTLKKENDALKRQVAELTRRLAAPS